MTNEERNLKVCIDNQNKLGEALDALVDGLHRRAIIDEATVLEVLKFTAFLQPYYEKSEIKEQTDAETANEYIAPETEADLHAAGLGAAGAAVQSELQEAGTEGEAAEGLASGVQSKGFDVA